MRQCIITSDYKCPA